MFRHHHRSWAFCCFQILYVSHTYIVVQGMFLWELKSFQFEVRTYGIVLLSEILLSKLKGKSVVFCRPTVTMNSDPWYCSITKTNSLGKFHLPSCGNEFCWVSVSVGGLFGGSTADSASWRFLVPVFALRISWTSRYFIYLMYCCYIYSSFHTINLHNFTHVNSPLHYTTLPWNFSHYPAIESESIKAKRQQ